MSEGKLLWKSIVKWWNEWIGHIIQHKRLLKLIIEECIEEPKRKTKFLIHWTNKGPRMHFVCINENKSKQKIRMEDGCKPIYKLITIEKKIEYTVGIKNSSKKK